MATHSTLSLVLDLLGVSVFGLAGGLTGVSRRLDVFGTAVLAMVTGLGGGVIRDVIIGHTPPAGFADWRYLACAGVAGLVAFVAHPALHRLTGPILLFDALGLGLFTVTGTITALSAGLSPLPAAALGVITGVGGGVLRDVLTREIPVVLHSELYAVPSLLGAAVIVIVGHDHRGVPTVAAVTAALLIAAFRLVAVWQGWRAPGQAPASPTS